MPHPTRLGTCRILAVLTLATAAVAAFPSQASALPLLQLYIEGATYDTEAESWVLEPPENGDAPMTLRLWAIGKSPVDDVRLAIAYESEFGQLDFQLEPSDTDHTSFPHVTKPEEPKFLQYQDDGSAPLLGDEETSLAGHGEYGNGIAWQEFLLGKFDGTETPLANFDGNFNFDNPDTEDNHHGQINIYEISVFPDPEGGPDGAANFHFDLYNSKEAGQSGNIKYWFAPFSHDAHGDVTVVPTPSAAVGGLACLALLGLRRVRTGAGRRARA